jgi:hypothetical protein
MRRVLVWCAKELGVPILMGLIFFAASVGPHAAASNISEWAHYFGLDAPPHWLQAQKIDTWAKWLAAFVTVFYIGLMWIQRASRKRRAATNGSRQLTKPLDIVHYIADESEWGAAVKAENDATVEGELKKYVLFSAVQELREAAAQGRIHFIGRKNDQGIHEEIAPVFWKSSSFSLEAMFSGKPAKTEPAVPFPTGIPIYTMVEATNIDLTTIWPLARRAGRRSPHR